MRFPAELIAAASLVLVVVALAVTSLAARAADGAFPNSTSNVSAAIPPRGWR